MGRIDDDVHVYPFKEEGGQENALRVSQVIEDRLPARPLESCDPVSLLN